VVVWMGLLHGGGGCLKYERMWRVDAGVYSRKKDTARIQSGHPRDTITQVQVVPACAGGGPAVYTSVALQVWILFVLVDTVCLKW